MGMKMVEQAVVRVDGSLAEEVRTYSRISGVSISRVLDEAISEWLEVKAVVKLSTLHEAIKARGPKAKLTQGEKELLARYEHVEGEGNVYHLHNDAPVPVEWRGGGSGRFATKEEMDRL
jgi:hypothetical protein